MIDMPKRTCSEDGCTGPVNARGLCDVCYQRRKRRNTLPPKQPRQWPNSEEQHGLDLERFLSFVDVDGPTMPHMDTNCHIWTGYLRHGYGGFHLKVNRKSVTVKSTVWAWQQFVGPIPADKPYLCHRCDNRACVRIDHLFPGTHQDNMDDMLAKNRQAYGERQGLAVLTEAQVIAIRAKRRDGATTKQLGLDFGVSTPTIQQIVSGKTWRHLLPPAE